MTSYRGEHADRIRNVSKITCATLERSAEVFERLAENEADLVKRSEYETLAQENRLNSHLMQMAINRKATRFDGRTEELKGEAA